MLNNKMNKLIHEEGSARYYITNYDDGAVILTTEIYDTVFLERKILGFKTVKKVDNPISVKILPLNPIVIYLMMITSNLESDGEITLVGNTIPSYPEISDFDNKDMVKELSGIYGSVTDKTDKKANIKFPLVPKNKVAKAYMREGFHFLCYEDNSMLSRTYYLYRTSKAGHLHLVRIEDSGSKLDDSMTAFVTTYLLSRDLISSVLGLIEGE